MSMIDAARSNRFDDPAHRRYAYEQNGYVVAPALIDEELCERAMACFSSEIKPYRGYLYRQASANPERNVFDSAGHVVNSLLNPLSVEGRRFPAFRSITEQILTRPALFEAVEDLCGETAVLVQSMYFEGNPATWPHQDCYYLDDDSPGRLLGAWIALEDIDERAGRFYLAPGTHRLAVGENAGDLRIVEHHDAYKDLMASIVASESVSLDAPALRRGDVLFWSSRVIHGAFAPSDVRFSRNSYTAHFIPASSRFMQYQHIPVHIAPQMLGGKAVCRPKDQDRTMNRWVLRLESRLPGLFPRLKRRIIAWKMRRWQRLGS